MAATLADVGEAAGRIGRELVRGRATVDELVAVTGWPVASVLAALTLLERRGLAVGVHGRFRPAGSLAGADPVTPAEADGRTDDPSPGPFGTVAAPREPMLPCRQPDLPGSARDPPSMLSPEATSQERRLLHKAAVALLAVPILSAVYLGALVRRSAVSRIGLAIVDRRAARRGRDRSQPAGHDHGQAARRRSSR